MKEQVSVTYTMTEVVDILTKQYLETREIYNDSVEVIINIDENTPKNTEQHRVNYVSTLNQMTKIEAIRKLRAEYNLGLKEAKDFVDDPRHQFEFISTGKMPMYATTVIHGQ